MSDSSASLSEYAPLFQEISSCHNPRFIVKKWIRESKRKRDIVRKEWQDHVGRKRQRFEYQHSPSDSVESTHSLFPGKGHFKIMKKLHTFETHSFGDIKSASFKFSSDFKPVFSNPAPSQATDEFYSSHTDAETPNHVQS